MTVVPRLVCLGNFTIDDVVFPDGSERLGCTGGDALYAALGARLWEPRVEMVAPVGDDLPTATRDRIAAAGLSGDGLPRRRRPTLRNRVVYDASGGRQWTLFATEEDFDALSPTPDDIPETYRGAEAFLVLAMTLAAQEALVAWLREHTPSLVALDPQEDYILGNERRLRALIGKVDLFLPSAEEVRRLLGHEDWSGAARSFAALGPRIVAIKLGSAGCLVYDAQQDRETVVPAYTSRVVDTTGAGDSFCGGFLAALLRDRSDIETAARAGSVSAGFAIAGYGADALFGAKPDEARLRLEGWRAEAARAEHA